MKKHLLVLTFTIIHFIAIALGWLAGSLISAYFDFGLWLPLVLLFIAFVLKYFVIYKDLEEKK